MYVKVCNACYAGNHDNCEHGSGPAENSPDGKLICGGWACICEASDHDVNKSEFAKSIWERGQQ